MRLALTNPQSIGVRFTRLTLAGIAGMALLASACTKADPTEVTEFANRSLRSNLTGLASAASVVERSDAPWAMADWAEGGSVEKSNPPGALSEEFQAIAEEISDWLATHVFHEDNVERNRGGKITYRLQPDSVCEYEDWDGTTRTDSECVTILTELPVRFVTYWGSKDQLVVEIHVSDLPIRPLDIELHDDFVSVAADLGEVVTMVETIAETLDEEMDFEFDLAGKVKLALVNEGDGSYSVTQSILEKVIFAIGARADYDHVRIELAPTEAAHMVLFAEDEAVVTVGMSTIDVSVARDLLMGDGGYWICDDDHCWQCEEDELGERCEWICEDWDTNCEYVEPESRLSGVFDLHLGGINGSMSMTTEDETIELFGLGLGDESMTISFNNIPIFVFDVNEDASRRFDLSLTPSEGDLFLGVAPAMSLNLQHDLTSIQGDLNLEGEIPAWLLGGFTRISLADSLAPVLRIFQISRSGGCDWVCESADPCWDCSEGDWCAWICDEDLCLDCVDEGDCEWICHEPCEYVCDEEVSQGPTALLQVVQGSLTLDADAIEQPIEIEAGQCLVELSDIEYDENNHPFVMLGEGVCE